MEVITPDLQLGAGGGAFGTGWSTGFGGGGWVSVLTDVRTIEPPAWRYGISGSDPSDRIADAGVMTFALNNGEWNSAHTLGWYSPLNAVKRGGFDFNIPVRMLITYAGQTWYKFLGKLSNLHVTPGAKEDRMVHCTAVDLMDDYANLPAPALDAQFGQRGDELVTTILDAVPTDLQPAARDIDVGLEVHPLAFDTLREEEMSVREALNQVCLSDLGRLYIVGSSVPPGGQLVYRNRHYAALNPSVQFAFNANIARGGLDVPGSRDDLVSKVQVFVHSTRTDPSPTTVLYDLQTTTTLIAPGETNSFLFGPYRDPNNPGDRIGARDQQPIVAYTDYMMNSSTDGTGVDLTPNFTATASFTGAGVRFTITNTGNFSGYVTKLQARGRGIYRFTVVIEKTVTAEYGLRVMQVDMPFQSNVNVGDDVATHLASTLSKPLARVRSVTFLANLSPAAMTAALSLEPGSARVSVTEEVTGLVAEEFTVLSVAYQLVPAARTPLLWCTWTLEPVSTQRFWILGLAGASELGTSTWVGF